MIILYVGIILILYSLLSKGKYNLTIAFMFVFLIMGFQNNVDGDFYSYMEEYENFSFKNSVSEKGEYFWLYLTYFFQKHVSFHVFIFLLSLFECYCVKKFIERFANERYAFISVILFFFTFNYMLMQMKALRQGLAVDLCMLSFVMIDRNRKKTILLAILLSLAAYYTHKSCLICICFVWGYWLYIRYSKSNSRPKLAKPIYFAIAILVLYFSKKAFLDTYLIPLLEMLDDDHYMNYARDFSEYAGQMGFLPILYNTIIVSIMAWYLQFAKNRERYFVIIAIIGVFVDVLVFATGSIQRLLLYFLFANLAVIPGMTCAIERKYGKIAKFIFFALLLGYALKTSLHWLISTVDDRFGNYQFIFLQ